MTEASGLIRGLEGVVAAETQLCDLDGANGRLAYRGYDIADLARQATFEEVTYLLLHGDLPRPAQLDGFVVQLTASRARWRRPSAHITACAWVRIRWRRARDSRTPPTSSTC
jgi:citrate synthase